MEVKRMTAKGLVQKLASSSSSLSFSSSPSSSPSLTSSLELQRQIVCEIRLLAKWDTDNRTCIAEAGAIPILFDLASFSVDPKVQENSVIALFNLSINHPNRLQIINHPSSLGSVLALLRNGLSTEVKENSVALLFSLLIDDDYRVTMGRAPGAIQQLVEFVANSSPKAQKDAVKCLFHLSLCQENCVLIAEAGAIPVLLELCAKSSQIKPSELTNLPLDPAVDPQLSLAITDDSLAVLAHIAGSPDALPWFRSASAVPALAQILEPSLGFSAKAKENAVSTLLRLYECSGNSKAVAKDLGELGPSLQQSLSELVQNGSLRAKGKASAIMRILLSTESLDNNNNSNNNSDNGSFSQSSLTYVSLR